ncbi:PAS domain S-box protein [Clostridiales bacterium BAD-6]|uniref:histidine kinase n=2 Tax=Sinanaerobacter chloroacetimidivorans TaxID=2818044 RepID=A0A8J7W568_9FIRM|nr:PAS domain S-box protein [Sinanaerobacter chloroacetimidivorans]
MPQFFTHKSMTQETLLEKINTIFIPIVFFIGIIMIGFYNFLLFHSIAELFSISIASVIFIISINTYKFNHSSYNLSLLGIAFGFIGIIDLLHTLAYKGMGVFPEFTADLPTQLWIVGRFIESISLLLFCTLMSRRGKLLQFFYIYFAITVFLLLSIFHWGIFPSCYIDGTGLTSFKIASEYIICGILAVTIFLLYRNKKRFIQKAFRYLISAILFMILSEICFMFYLNVYGIENMAGHILKIISFYCIYKSIAEENLKKPYRELYYRGRDYYKLIKLLPEAVLIHVKGRIVFINDAGLKLFGVSNSNQILNTSIFKYINPEDQVDMHHWLMRPNDGENRYPSTLVNFIASDQKNKEVAVCTGPYIYNNECAAIMVLHDLSQQKQVESLEKKVKQGEELLKERTEYERLRTIFFANLSHEFKTPLNVILGAVQLLEHTEKDYETVKTVNKYIKSIKQNCNRILRLTNNLIDITKADSGYLKLNLCNYNIISILEDIVVTVADHVRSNGVEIVFDTDVEEKLMACDPDKIERIMLNLLSNALKFSDNQGVITVNVYDRAESISISVQDNGIGIPEDKLGTIFDRFVQVDQSLSRNTEGSGIGLSLIKAFVELHQGTISVNSEMGKGTQFLIELPCRLVEETYHREEKESFIHQNRIEKISVEFADIYSIT